MKWCMVSVVLLTLLICSAGCGAGEPEVSTGPEGGSNPVWRPTAGVQPSVQPVLGDTWTRPADGVTMVHVPSGEFQLICSTGCRAGEPAPAPSVTVEAALAPTPTHIPALPTAMATPPVPETGTQGFLLESVGLETPESVLYDPEARPLPSFAG